MTIENIRKYFKKKLLPHPSGKSEPGKSVQYEIGKYYDIGPTGCIEEQIKALQSKGISNGSIVPFFYFEVKGTLKNLNLYLISETIVIT